MAIDDLVAGGPAGGAATTPASPAPCPTSPETHWMKHLTWMLSARGCGEKTPKSSALLDQGVISGIGNIYADEALWATQLHYRYPTNRLSKKTFALLIQNVKDVLVKALGEGGTSFDQQYVNVNGKVGFFPSLMAYGHRACPAPGARASW